MIKTEAGELMKQQNPMENIDKADENADGVIDGQELLRQELMKQGNIVGAPDMPEMNMGGLMHGGMGVIIGIEETSGNEIPAGSKPEEVADDIPAVLSEGEYVVPADVVRWHGVKTFESLRCEAKMGMGLMAQDGRIAMVDDDTKEPIEHEIEEEDAPEVEKAEYKVVEAADGTDVQVDYTEPEPILPFYQLRYITDPDTGRTRMAYVDPVTGQEVSPEKYEESRASRFAPQTVLEQQGIVEKIAEDIADEEEDEVTEPTTAVSTENLFPRKSDEESPSGQALSRTSANNYGYTEPVGAVAGFAGPIGAAIAFADNLNAASAVNAARQAYGLDGISFTDQLGAGVTGQYRDGYVGEIPYEGNTYQLSLSGKDVEINGNKVPTITPFDFDDIDSGIDFPSYTPDKEDPFVGDEIATRASEKPKDYGIEGAGYQADRSFGIEGEGYGGTTSTSSEEDDDDLNESDDTFDMNKGGYVTRKNKPRVAMMKY